MTANMWVATLAYVLLLLGLLARRRRRVHVPLVVSGILLDVGLVLSLQLERHAVQTAFSFSLGLLAQIHIGLSTVALILYFPVAFLGIRILLGHSSSRTLHRRLALLAFSFRTGGFLFMFSLLD
jgi:hypothetical protein